jgi:hypothetical protein
VFWNVNAVLLSGRIPASGRITVPSSSVSGGTEELGFLDFKIFEYPDASHSNLPTHVYNAKSVILLTLKMKAP